jgi:hypothetical protein
MPPAVAVPAELLVITHWVEVPLVEMVLELMQIQWRQMVSPTRVVVAAGQIMEQLAVADQESSLFVIRFQPHRLFRLHL